MSYNSSQSFLGAPKTTAVHLRFPHSWHANSITETIFATATNFLEHVQPSRTTRSTAVFSLANHGSFSFLRSPS